VRRSIPLILSGLFLACSPPAPRTHAPSTQVEAAHAASAAPAPVAAARTLPAHDPSQAGVAVGIHGAVASAEANASRIGVAVLGRGGNAIDAAIAVAFALAVTQPNAGNIGGGGFMLVRMADGTATAFDYRETAPAAATPNMYLDAAGKVTHDSVLGARAAGIPGTVAGLALAHQRFGRLPWAVLVEPALALARDGHVLDDGHAADMAKTLPAMRDAGFKDSVRVYSAENGAELHAGDVWKQPDLAATLELIAHQGPRAFYEGPLAERMAQGVKALGGIWTSDDLRKYRAVERKPIVFEYRGHQVLSMPPPSSGGIVLRQILAASELLDMQSYPWRSVQGFHLYAEAARRAYADRNELLGDPDFVHVPVEQLTSLDYIKKRMSDIDPHHATPSDRIHGGIGPDELPQTTHFSVVDDDGNAVANTYTLNGSFGAKAVIPGTGILLNNEMDDFAAKPGAPNMYGLVQSARNAIAPGKRMLSSMTPTILVKDGKLRAIVGSPGGPTITNTVAEIVRALIDYAQPLDIAVRAPRLHHQWLPDQIMIERDFEPEIASGLEALGHHVERIDAFGHANCIEVDPATHGYRAVADVQRKGGEADAY
jgi:gamma-glutamyltranspeptidase/glutathione hydrolase